MSNEFDPTIVRQFTTHEISHDELTLQRVAGALGQMDLSTRAGVVEHKPFVPAAHIEHKQAASQIINQRREDFSHN